jgi:hypothetical protein
MTNRQVAEAWGRDQYAQSNNMRSVGGSLFSYEMEIGRTNKGEKEALLVRGEDSYSQTTSCHVGLAVEVADITVKPRWSGGWAYFPK